MFSNLTRRTEYQYEYTCIGWTLYKLLNIGSRGCGRRKELDRGYKHRLRHEATPNPGPGEKLRKSHHQGLKPTHRENV